MTAFLRTAVATRAALMRCHFKSTLTLARADRRRRKSTAAKNPQGAVKRAAWN